MGGEILFVPNRPLGSQNSAKLDIGDPAGWAAVELGSSGQRHLPASVEGKVLIGLPVLGFWASTIVNNNVSNGVLANYASAVRHATSVTCVKASDGMPCD